MTLDTLETIVKKALSNATQLCVFGFQGGEPTLAGLDFFRALISFEKAHNKNKVSIQHTMQTNGLLLNDEWARFLTQNEFLVGLSIDGPKAAHDAFRLDSMGKGTQRRCLEAARLLKIKKTEFNILSVITRELAAHPDRAWRFYENQEFRYLQFIPCLDPLDNVGEFEKHALDATLYGKFLCRIFDLWYKAYCDGNYVSVRDFDNYIRILMGEQPESCALVGVCSAYALVEADGSVYPCDFYALDQYRLGNIHTHSLREMLGGAVAESFIAPSRQPDSSCTICEYYFLCRGGCRRERAVNGTVALGRNIYCDAYMQLFAHALPRMEVIARMLSGRRA
jgi:uncharacterized protein